MFLSRLAVLSTTKSCIAFFLTYVNLTNCSDGTDENSHKRIDRSDEQDFNKENYFKCSASAKKTKLCLSCSRKLDFWMKNCSEIDLRCLNGKCRKSTRRCDGEYQMMNSTVILTAMIMKCGVQRLTAVLTSEFVFVFFFLYFWR